MSYILSIRCNYLKHESLSMAGYPSLAVGTTTIIWLGAIIQHCILYQMYQNACRDALDSTFRTPLVLYCIQKAYCLCTDFPCCQHSTYSIAYCIICTTMHTTFHRTPCQCAKLNSPLHAAIHAALYSKLHTAWHSHQICHNVYHIVLYSTLHNTLVLCCVQKPHGFCTNLTI